VFCDFEMFFFDGKVDYHEMLIDGCRILTLTRFYPFPAIHNSV
jgi:hypothetical protein